MSAETCESNDKNCQKGAISKLQEYVQCSHTFHLPSNYSVLQWTFHSKMADAATLEFRAIVAFILEGVPHHIAGKWMPKKKDAQRDAAERALVLFAERWGEPNAPKVRRPSALPVHITATPGRVYEEVVFEKHCEQLEDCRSYAPVWTVHWDGAECHAVVAIQLLGVPHHLAGSKKPSEAAARKDVALRALWYLQHPDYQDQFEADPASHAIVSGKISAPPAEWCHDPVAEGAEEVAERKTAIMRVQNRLQQMFSKELVPGVSVWSWNYEMENEESEHLAQCRASVCIPVLNKTFAGDWMRGQRDAQLETIKQVRKFLDAIEAKH